MEGETVYLSLGSNAGDREAELQSAVARLASKQFEILHISSVYETAPMYFREQENFLNMVVEGRTTLPPTDLLQRVLDIEQEMGRRRTVPNGPRLIDIDVLFFGECLVDTPQLRVPHPKLQERRFVLEPLVEIAPDLKHPVTGESMRALLAAAPDEFVRKTSVRITAPHL